jgi:WhiB family redox-sensing transcriptional regulator
VRLRGSLGLDDSWMVDGICHPDHVPRHHPNVWFPNDGAGVLHAQRLCSVCPVQVECLEYALDLRINHGVWGGESERGRRVILKEMGVDVSVLQGVATPAERDATEPPD